jgi:hypothetical protein
MRMGWIVDTNQQISVLAKLKLVKCANQTRAGDRAGLLFVGFTIRRGLSCSLPGRLPTAVPLGLKPQRVSLFPPCFFRNSAARTAPAARHGAPAPAAKKALHASFKIGILYVIASGEGPERAYQQKRSQGEMHAH